MLGFGLGFGYTIIGGSVTFALAPFGTAFGFDRPLPSLEYVFGQGQGLLMACVWLLVGFAEARGMTRGVRLGEFTSISFVLLFLFVTFFYAVSLNEGVVSPSRIASLTVGLGTLSALVSSMCVYLGAIGPADE